MYICCQHILCTYIWVLNFNDNNKVIHLEYFRGSFSLHFVERTLNLRVDTYFCSAAYNTGSILYASRNRRSNNNMQSIALYMLLCIYIYRILGNVVYIYIGFDSYFVSLFIFVFRLCLDEHGVCMVGMLHACIYR